MVQLKKDTDAAIRENIKTACVCSPNKKLRARIQANDNRSSKNDIECFEKIVSDQQKRIDELKHENVILRQKYENLKYKHLHKIYS